MMKKLVILSVLTIAAIININCTTRKDSGNGVYPTMEELDAQYKAAWDKPEYAAANSAATEKYLTDLEKKIFYYLNLARMNPALFASTYATGYKGANGYANNEGFEENAASLIAELKSMGKLSTLYPSKEMYRYAQCQALAVGSNQALDNDPHNRTISGCAIPGAYGENINFGNINALDAVMSWLNDAGNALGVNQMGHRKNCLNPTFDSMGIAVGPHNTYGKCIVMDLKSK